MEDVLFQMADDAEMSMSHAKPNVKRKMEQFRLKRTQSTLLDPGPQEQPEATEDLTI